MSYTIYILRRAQKELAQLPSSSYERIRDAVRSLANDPRPPGSIKLSGRKGWRIRIGDYRVIYGIDDDQNIITVYHVGHRRNVYH